jgi:hypothetical protein
MAGNTGVLTRMADAEDAIETVALAHDARLRSAVTVDALP